MATSYQIPSSFAGGIDQASSALGKGNIPQITTSPFTSQTNVAQPILPQKKITMLPQKIVIDPNKTPEAFKKRFIEKHGDGVAEDGRKYSQIPAPEIVAKVIRKYGDGVTTDGIPYREFLPRPASPNDPLEYRLKQIESLYGGPKSEFYTTGEVRGQTKKEAKFSEQATNRKYEGELIKTLKSPYRAVTGSMESFSSGIHSSVADALDVFGANDMAKKLRAGAIESKSQQEVLNQDNKGFIGGIQEGSPSSIIGAFVGAIPNLLLYANPVGATAGIVSTGGGLSLEGEMQGQNTAGDKIAAYSAGTISGLIDKISGQKFLDGLLSKGIKQKVAQGFVDKTKNFLATLKPSDFEAGTEILQQKIENWGREVMGTEYDKGWKQYIESGILGKALGKVADVGFSTAPTEIAPSLPPKTPRPVGKNLEVIQTIKTGLGGNKVLKQAKGRGFDPELDIATYEDLKPTITNDGRVNTDVAQENIQNFIEPYQEKLDQAIEQEGAIVPSDVFRQKVLQEMEGEKGNIVDYKKWVKLANDAIDTAVENFGDEQGNIPLASVNAIKKKLQMASNYLNPDDTAYKAIARGAKQIVENYTKSADVKALNNDLARWYTTREYLQILGSGTKTVKGGRLGKYAARLAGVIIGSNLGPIAGMVGGEIASKLQSNMMKGAFKNTNTGIPEIESFRNLPSRQTSEDTTVNKTMLPPPAQVSEGIRKTEVVLPKKQSSGEKVNTPIIPKSQPKAKLRTNEDALKKTELPKTPQEGKTRDFGKYKNTEPGVHLNPLVQKINDKALSMKMDSGQSLYLHDIKNTLQHSLKRGGHTVNLKPDDIHGVYTLDEFIDHPKLFEKYKGLKNQEVVLADFHTTKKRGVVSDGKIYLNSKIFAKDKNDAYSTLVHEIEHRLQAIRKQEKYGGDFGNTINKAEMEELAINIQNEFRKSVGLDERSKISFDNPAPKPSPLSQKSEVKYSKPNLDKTTLPVEIRNLPLTDRIPGNELKIKPGTGEIYFEGKKIKEFTSGKDAMDWIYSIEDNPEYQKFIKVKKDAVTAGKQNTTDVIIKKAKSFDDISKSSQVKDTVFHGTPQNDFIQFKLGKKSNTGTVDAGEAIWFTNSKAGADYWSNYSKDGGRTLEVKILSKNMAEVSGDEIGGQFGMLNTIEQAKNEGYDGLIIDQGAGEKWYAVFDPENAVTKQYYDKVKANKK